MTPEQLLSIASAHALGLEFTVPGTRGAAWTVAEAAQACAGVPPHVFAALLYSYARAEECAPVLERELGTQASLIAFVEKWPTTTKRRVVRELDPGFVGPPYPRPLYRFYLADLVTMALLEERDPWRFVRAGNQPDPRRVLMGVSQQTWRQELAPRYGAVREVYLGWLSVGVGRMRRRMRRDEQSIAEDRDARASRDAARHFREREKRRQLRREVRSA